MSYFGYKRIWQIACKYERIFNLLRSKFGYEDIYYKRGSEQKPDYFPLEVLNFCLHKKSFVYHSKRYNFIKFSYFLQTKTGAYLFAPVLVYWTFDYLSIENLPLPQPILLSCPLNEWKLRSSSISSKVCWLISVPFSSFFVCSILSSFPLCSLNT